MSRNKCPDCGLVKFPIADACERCGAHLSRQTSAVEVTHAPAGEQSGGDLHPSSLPQPRSWRHYLGKALLVAAPLIGAVPTFLFDLVMSQVVKNYYSSFPLLFWLPLPVAAVALCLLLLETRFSGWLSAASCLFLVVGPMVSVDMGGGPLHGGEIIPRVHFLFGLLSLLLAVPGLLLWNRRAGGGR